MLLSPLSYPLEDAVKHKTSFEMEMFITFRQIKKTKIIMTKNLYKAKIYSFHGQSIHCHQYVHLHLSVRVFT